MITEFKVKSEYTESIRGNRKNYSGVVEYRVEGKNSVGIVTINYHDSDSIRISNKINTLQEIKAWATESKGVTIKHNRFTGDNIEITISGETAPQLLYDIVNEIIKAQ